jgi:hypothetical protein
MVAVLVVDTLLPVLEAVAEVVKMKPLDTQVRLETHQRQLPLKVMTELMVLEVVVDIMGVAAAEPGLPV